jgi:hypothetical protein
MAVYTFSFGILQIDFCRYVLCQLLDNCLLSLMDWLAMDWLAMDWLAIP